MTSTNRDVAEVRPDRAAFRALAADHSVVPVWRELLADLITPVAAFARLCGDDRPGFLFESVEHGERWSRWSFVGRNPIATLVLRGGSVEVEGELPADMPRDRGILAAVEWLLAAYRSPTMPDLPPFHGGVVGYLGYDVVREVEDLPDIPTDATGYPDAVLSVIGEMAAFDHFRQRVSLIENVIVPAGADDATLDRLYDEAIDRLDRLAADGASPLAEPMVDPPMADPGLPEVERSVSDAGWLEAIDVARQHILDGDIFQVVLSQRYSFDLDADPFDFYRVLRQVNPSPYMYFVRTPEVTLAGSSPEPMVRLVDGRVISRPIAGTRRRGATDEEDRRLGAELREHPKEIAEHVMLIDLARNDVGRIAETGSVRVNEQMVVERYSHVMHLVSTVTGQVREDLTGCDVLYATFPAGTLSGAPKPRAMQIIESLETSRRGVYGGAVGYLDFAGNVDMAIAIRTAVLKDGVAYVQAGAGVVADSIPLRESEECENKAAAVLHAVALAGSLCQVAERHE